MPVARNVWQPMAVSMPASAARRRTMRHTSLRVTGRPESSPVLPIADRNSGPLRSSPMPAASDVGVKVCFQGVVAGHFVELAVFLIELEPTAFCLRVVIFDGQRDNRANAGEGVRHPGDDGAIAQAYQAEDLRDSA